jgi:HEPN domain-containing protein
LKRTDFQQIAKQRVAEAKALLDAGHHQGAYYLVGYTVECALKSCVAKQVNRCDFPDRKLAEKAFTHDLGQLLKVAGLELQFEQDRHANPALDVNWAIVKDWSETSRYDLGINALQARDLYSAVAGRNGVFPWLRKRW